MAKRKKFAIEIEQSITQEMITPLHGIIGQTNDKPVSVQGKAYAARALVFRGFCGRINMDTRNYDGVLCFEPVAGTTGDVLGECFPIVGFSLVLSPVEAAEEPAMNVMLDTEISNGTDSDTSANVDAGDDVGQSDE